MPTIFDNDGFDEIKKEPEQGDFSRGLSGGWAGTKGAIQGAVGLAADAVGADKVRDWALEHARANFQKQEELARPYDEAANVETAGEAGKYFAHAAGELAPTLAQIPIAILSGGATTPALLASTAGKQLVERGIARGLSKEVAEKAAEATLKKAATDGVFAGMGAAQGAGTLYPTLDDQGGNDADNVAKSLGYGTAAGVVGILPGMRAANKLVGGAMGAADKTYVGRLGREVVQQGALGGASGVGQNVINRQALGLSQDGDDALMSNINAGVSGAVGGALLSPLSAMHRNPINPGTKEPQNILGGTNEQPQVGINVVTEPTPLQGRVDQAFGIDNAPTKPTYTDDPNLSPKDNAKAAAKLDAQWKKSVKEWQKQQDQTRAAREADITAAMDESSAFTNRDENQVEQGPKSMFDLHDEIVDGMQSRAPETRPLAIETKNQWQRQFLGQQGDPSQPIHLLGNEPAPAQTSPVSAGAQPTYMQLAAEAYRKQQDGQALTQFEAAAARHFAQQGGPAIERVPQSNLKPEPAPPAPLVDHGQPQRTRESNLAQPGETDFQRKFLGQVGDTTEQPIAVPHEPAPAEPQRIISPGPSLEDTARTLLHRAANGELLTQREHDIVRDYMERRAAEQDKPAPEIPVEQRNVKDVAEPQQGDLPGIEKPLRDTEPRVEKLAKEQEARGSAPGQYDMFDQRGEPTYGAAADSTPDFARVAEAVAQEARYKLNDKRRPLATKVEQFRHEGLLDNDEADTLHNALAQSKYGTVEKALAEATASRAKEREAAKAAEAETAREAARKEAADTWNESFHMDGDPEFKELPKALREEWEQAHADNKATTELYDSIVRRAEDAEFGKNRASARDTKPREGATPSEQRTAEKLQAEKGWTPPEGEPTVKRAADFKDTGYYDVKWGDREAQMSRDPESGWWYRKEFPGEKQKHFTDRFLGFNKAESLEALKEILRNTKKWGNGEPDASAHGGRPYGVDVPHEVMADMHDGQSLIDHLAANAKSPLIRAIAAKLARLPEMADVKVRMDSPEIRVGMPEKIQKLLDRSRAIYVHDPVNAVIWRKGEAKEDVLAHELLHAAMVRRIERDPAARREFQRFFEQAKREIRAKYGDEALKKMEAGPLEDIDEFIAYGFTDPIFRADLAKMRVSGAEATRPSLWERFVGMVRRVLGIPEKSAEAVNEVMKADVRMLDAMDSALDKALGKDAAPLDMKDAVASAASDWNVDPEKVAKAAKEAPKQLAESMAINTLGKLRRGKLGMMFSRDISEHYGDMVKGPEGQSLVKDYIDHSFKMASTANELLKRAGDAINNWARVKDVDKLNELAWKSTMMGINPDAPIGPETSNKHLIRDGKVSEQDRANHATLRQRWNELSPEGRRAYDEVRKMLADNWTRREKALNKQVMDLYDPLIAQAKKDGNTESATRLMRERDATISEFGIRLARVEGPYFPLMRFGDYFVNHKSEDFTAAESELEAARESYRKLADKYAVPYGKDLKATERANRALPEDERLKTKLTEDEREEIMDARAKVRKLEDKLSGMKENDKHYSSESFESEAAASRRAKELGVPVRRAAEHFRELAPMNRGFMDRMQHSLEAALPANQVSAAREALAQLYLQTLPDLSAMKNQMRRENVAGFSQNMTRNVAAYTRREAHYLSRVEHMDDLSSTLMQMERSAKEATDPNKATEVYNEMAKRHVASMNYTETPIQDALARVSFAYQLGVSPGFLLTNMTQPWMLSMPMMAGKHGLGETNKQLAKAFGEVSKVLASGIKQKGERWNVHAELDLSKFSDAEQKMLTDAQKQGLLDVTMEADLGAYERGSDPTNKLSRFSRALAVAPHQVEVVNRAMTALAAYRMEIAKGADHDTAAKYAQDILAKTHFDYSNINAPRPFRPGALPFGKLLTQYKKYTVGVISLLAGQAKQMVKGASAEERAAARNALIGTVAMHLAVAGVMGLPGAGLGMNLINVAMNTFGDPNESHDAEQGFRAWLTDSLGLDAEQGAAIAKGLPILAGLDVSRKIGLGDVFSPVNVNGHPKTNEDLGKELLIAGLGPAIGQGLNMLKGLDFMGSGQWGKGIEQLVPRSVGDVLKAARYGNEGITTNKGDVSITPDRISPWDQTIAAMGFTPAVVSERGAAVSAVNEAKQDILDRRQSLMRDWVKAYTARDVEAVTAAREEVQKFNAARQQHGEQIIKPADLLNAYKARQRDSKSMTHQGVMLAKKDRPLGKYGDFAYVKD